MAMISESVGGEGMPRTAPTLLGLGESGDPQDAARKAAATRDVSRRTIERLGGGWVGEEALAIALFCALTAGGSDTGSVAAALWRACAHAGDSDSTGSLTGNLLGAMLGVEALPRAWLEDLELRDVIESVALDLHAACVLGREPDPKRYPPG
jgi:ADP-ribosylglycohydrolase